MIKISLVVITYNEERNIQRCLSSCQGLVDEMLVVDSFSEDDTQNLARSLGARVLEHAFTGHIEQKNWAKAQAQNDWVLSLDADEALSDELRESILKIKQQPAADGYYLQRLTNYCGAWIRHGNWYPDLKLRLWDRRKGNWGGQNPHDEFIIEKNTRTAVLSGHLLHYSFYEFSEHLKQIRRFTDISSRAAFEKGKRSNWLKIISSPTWKFIKGYLLKKGFMDGKAGWQIAYWSAYATYLKYSKLKQIQKEAS